MNYSQSLEKNDAETMHSQKSINYFKIQIHVVTFRIVPVPWDFTCKICRPFWIFFSEVEKSF